MNTSVLPGFADIANTLSRSDSLCLMLPDNNPQNSFPTISNAGIQNIGKTKLSHR